MNQTCPACLGSGNKWDDILCKVCEGTGSIDAINPSDAQLAQEAKERALRHEIVIQKRALETAEAELSALKEQIVVMQKENRRLVDAIRVEQTGLAKALESCVTTANSYNWIGDGRGPYAFNDDAYKQETMRLCQEIASTAANALQQAGFDATKILHQALTAKNKRESLASHSDKQPQK